MNSQLVPLVALGLGKLGYPHNSIYTEAGRRRLAGVKHVILLMAVVALVGCVSDPNEKANELFVESVELISSAEEKPGKEAIKDYEKALATLQIIISDYSKSDLAVKIVSGEKLFSGKSLNEIKERFAELEKYEDTKMRVDARYVIIRSVKPPPMRKKFQAEWEWAWRRWIAAYGLKTSDAANILKTIPGVKRVLPILNQPMNVAHGDREAACQLLGTYPYYPEFTQSKLVAGRFLNETDENTKALSCVISLKLAKKLFAGHNPLMEHVVVQGYESKQVFRVVGILQERVDTEKLPQLADAVGHTISANVYIPLSTFKSFYGIKNIDRSVGALSVEEVELSEIRVEFGSPDEVIAAIPLLRDALNKGRKGEVDYEIHTPFLQK